MTDIRFRRVDPTAGKNRLLAVRRRDRKVYRADVGDAHAIVVPHAGTLRIPYIEAEGDTRMSTLLDALTDAVDCRSIRFVAARVRDSEYDRAVNEAAKRVFGVDVWGDKPYLEDVLHDFERVDEEWHPDRDDVDVEQTVTCIDVEWRAD